MKALIIRFSAIGDVLLVTGPLRNLKQEFPDLEVHLLTSETGAELFQGSIDIDKIHILPKGAGLFETLKTYRQLSRYDVILDLQGKLNSLLVRFVRRGKYYRLDKQSRERRAFAKSRKHKEDLSLHVVEKYYELFKKAFLLKEASLEDLRPHFIAKPVSFEKSEFDFSNAIILHPYASQKNKIWPYFTELIEMLESKGENLVIVGQENESPITYESKKTLNLTNKTSLGEMAALMATCKAVISTDSGPMHLAVALAKPTLAIFGPTTKEFGFYPEFSQCSVIENEALPCRPCHVHGGNVCPLKHHLCMRDIKAKEVLARLQELLKTSSSV